MYELNVIIISTAVLKGVFIGVLLSWFEVDFKAFYIWLVLYIFVVYSTDIANLLFKGV